MLLFSAAFLRLRRTRSLSRPPQHHWRLWPLLLDELHVATRRTRHLAGRSVLATFGLSLFALVALVALVVTAVTVGR